MQAVPDSRFGWLTSIAFWVCLLSSAALYAMAALSPAWLANLQLSQRHFGTQVRLVALESEDLRLQRIVEALRTNPRYAQELAQQNFQGVAGKADESLPLEGDLALQTETSASPDLAEDPELPWFAPLLAILVEDRGVNSTLLILAAVIVVYAFGFLQSGSAGSDSPASP